MSLSKKLGVVATNLVLSILVVASSYSAAQTTPRPARKPFQLAKWNPQPQQLFVAYWTVEPGWNTTLEIRNNLAQRDLSVIPVLRTSDGKEITLPPVTLASEQVAGVDLRQALATAAPEVLDKPGSFGSAICRYNSNDSANVFASTIVQHPGTPIGFHFDDTDIDTKLDVATVESVWWLPAATSSDLLVLANASTKPLSTAVTATDVAGRSYATTVGLHPGQTDRLDLRTLTGQSGGGAMGGLTVSITKGAGSLIVSHFVFDESTGLSAIMKTFERDPSETPIQHTLRAPMLALAAPDPTLGFPADTTLLPQVLLRNTTSVAVNPSLTLDWRSVANHGQVPIAVASLKPGEVRIVNLASVASQATVPGDAYWGTLTLNYQGRYGDVVPIASSFDSSGKYGMQTPFSEGLNHLWKGSMWHVDGMRNSIITTGNGGTVPTKAALTLFYDNGKNSYTMEQLLQPGQQLWADVGALIRNGIPDKNGNVIPSDVTMGSYELRDVDHYAAGLLFEGKLVIDKTWGHGYYGCAACCGKGLANFNPDPYSDIISNGTWNTIYAYDYCAGGQSDVTEFAYNWASGDTTVATVASAYTTIMGDGSTTGSSYVDINNNDALRGCPVQTRRPSAPIHVPHHLVVLNDSTAVGCTTNGTVVRLITYAEVDINGVNVGTINTREQFGTTSTNTCNTGNPSQSTTCSPDPGVLKDQITVGCNSVGGSCGWTSTQQQWQFCPPNGGTPVTFAAPGDLVVHNDSITVGGTTSFPQNTKIGPNGVFQ